MPNHYSYYCDAFAPEVIQKQECRKGQVMNTKLLEPCVYCSKYPEGQ
jgi:hypothetical protein